MGSRLHVSVTDRAELALLGQMDRNHNGGSFADFYAEHSLGLLRWLARQTLDPEVALDLTAEAFAQAFVARRRVWDRAGDERVRWLYGIARNLLYRYWRNGKIEASAIRRLAMERVVLAPSEQERLEREIDIAAARQELDLAAEQLSEQEREAVRLRVIDECTYAEIAGRLGVSEPTARKRVSRGLRKLALHLERSRASDNGPMEVTS